MATGISASKRMYTSLYWPWLFVGAAWIVAVVATLTGQRFLIDHQFLLEESGLPWPLAAALFLIGWQIMIAAMMEPTSIPFAGATLIDSTQGNRWPHRPVAAFFTAYASAWTVFGALAFAGDTAIHHTVDAWPWLAAHSNVIGAATCAIAGLYQYSPWKSRSLARCRVRHLPATASTTSPWRLGLRHGIDSIVCCWALMLVMVGLGAGDLAWMAAIALMLLSETLLPGETASRRARQIIGVAMLILAGLWLAHAVWVAPGAIS